MRSHFIPRFVLEKFTDAAGFIRFLDTRTGEIKKSTPTKVGKVNGLYDDDLEHRFEREIETPLSRVIGSIVGSVRSGGALEVNRREALGCCRGFVLQQLIRTPHAKMTASKSVRERTVDDYMGLIGEAGIYGVDEAMVKDVLDEARDDAERLRGSRFWSDFLRGFLDEPSSVLPRVVAAVERKGMILATTETAFVLGDRGAVSLVGNGRTLEDPGTQVYYPIAKDVALILGGRRDAVQRVPVDREATRKLNLQTLRLNRTVFSHSERLLRSLADPR